METHNKWQYVPLSRRAAAPNRHVGQVLGIKIDISHGRIKAMEVHSLKKVLVVTGGSRGIGAATARLAAQAGYAVCISFLRDRAAASAVVDEIRQVDGEAIAVAFKKLTE